VFQIAHLYWKGNYKSQNINTELTVSVPLHQSVTKLGWSHTFTCTTINKGRTRT